MSSGVEELRAEIMAEMIAAMNDAKEAMFDDTQSEVIGYYTGSPKVYHRTGQLLTIPRADPVTGGGYTVTTRIYLHDGGGYSTGSNPSMATVINWTNGGGGGTIGNHGYWGRAVSKMGKSFNAAFGAHFG